MDSKKIVEAAVLGGVLVVSANAFAQSAACTAGTAASVAGGTTAFVKSAFTPKCSANVHVSILDSTASFSVKSNSVKGKSDFGGSTEGGGISVCSSWTSHAAPTAGATGC